MDLLGGDFDFFQKKVKKSLQIKKKVVSLQWVKEISPPGAAVSARLENFRIMEQYTKNYNGFEVEVREDSENYYVNFGTGAGEGIYPKSDWSLEAAMEDQLKLDQE